VTEINQNLLIATAFSLQNQMVNKLSILTWLYYLYTRWNWIDMNHLCI